MLRTANILLLLLYLDFVFIAAPLAKTRKKKNIEKERGDEKEEEIRRMK